jgi:hypothetical protein
MFWSQIGALSPTLHWTLRLERISTLTTHLTWDLQNLIKFRGQHEIYFIPYPTLILSLFISIFLANIRQSMQIFQGIFKKKIFFITFKFLLFFKNSYLPNFSFIVTTKLTSHSYYSELPQTLFITFKNAL